MCVSRLARLAPAALSALLRPVSPARRGRGSFETSQETVDKLTVEPISEILPLPGVVGHSLFARNGTVYLAQFNLPLRWQVEDALARGASFDVRSALKKPGVLPEFAPSLVWAAEWLAEWVPAKTWEEVLVWASTGERDTPYDPEYVEEVMGLVRNWD